MAVFNLFLSTIFLPVIAVILLWRRPRLPLVGWVATFVMTSGVVAFSVFAAPWGWFGVPTRIVLAIAFCAALVISLRRPKPIEPVDESAVRLIIKIVIGFFFGGVAVGVLRAHSVPPRAINLRLPLPSGTYLVMHGGSTPAANTHFADAKQRYAVDFVQLNRAGFRARGLYPRDMASYEIFGRRVLSPCDGSIIAAVDAFADGAPDPKNPLGNHVVVRCGDASVTLANLRRGSVRARVGAVVAGGAHVGNAGHSGLSPEPHLHVHAERNGVATPMVFDRRWLVRNAIVRR